MTFEKKIWSLPRMSCRHTRSVVKKWSKLALKHAVISVYSWGLHNVLGWGGRCKHLLLYAISFSISAVLTSCV